ncbi:MAG: CoA pyrophosphatase [Corynebacterium sp.]|nr:CoA pyrophosphatase [Corynebacterium sp.]
MEKMQPHPDTPGTNVQLRPEAAPKWLRPILDVSADDIVGVLGERIFVNAKPYRNSAAVLVAFTGTNVDDACVLLTHRSPHLRSHSGQIAFPGGRVDPPDLNMVDTALRESWEETGLDRDEIIPLKDIGTVPIPFRGIEVNVVLAYWPQPGQVGVINVEEADDVFIYPVAKLLALENQLTVAIDEWQGKAFRCNDYIIWGFTAAVLVAIFHTAGWIKKWETGPVVKLSTVLASSSNNERLAH